MRRIYIIGAMAVLFAGCKPSVNITKAPIAGSADFSNYLAIGNSLTAGYTDGSLTVSGQLNSYPERLFEQFSLIQGSRGAKGPFLQPLLNSDNGYPGPKFILGITHSACIPGDSSLSPIPFPNYVQDPTDATYTGTTNNFQLNNIGVPGIKVADYRVAGYALITQAAGVPYAARFYHDPTTTPLDELKYRVNNLYPTFFTLWLGANDVLAYATAGGQGDGTGNATPVLPPYFYGPNDITPLAVFDTCYDLALNAAIATGASGALINIPDVTSVPFFTTVPANGLTLTRQGQADTLQAYWGAATWNKVFQVGANYFIIEDNKGNPRQAVPGELILLTVPQDSLTCAGWGTTKPIPAKYVLTTDELQFIRNMTANYNAYIKFEAQLHHLAYVDINAYLGTLSSGIVFNGVNYTSQFVTGGAFSLDGIHPTQRGYALIANQIITTINSFYGSTIPSIDANKYHGVNFPNGN